jgi:hypothetical protein
MTRPKRPKRPKPKQQRAPVTISVSVTRCAYCEGLAAWQIDGVPSDAEAQANLRAHIEACPKHPLAKALRRIRLLEARLKKAGRR